MSCARDNGPGIDFAIHNQAGYTISDIRISASSQGEGVHMPELLSPGSVLFGALPLTGQGSDGSYILEYSRADGSKYRGSHGYYTNGSNLEKRMEIEIRPDTVLLEFKDPIVY